MIRNGLRLRKYHSGRLLDLQQAYRARLHAARASAHLLRLVDELFATPALTIPGTAKLLGVTQRAAQLNFGKLIAQGILHEVTGRRRNRVFVARAILEAIEEAPLGGPG